MINDIFEEIRLEAKTGEISFKENVNNEVLNYFFRVKFNIADGNNDNINLCISDRNKFNLLLNKYVLRATNFYNLDLNHDNIKLIILYLLVNVTKKDCKDLNVLVEKYLSYMDNNILSNKNFSKNTSIGELSGFVLKQSFKQETPFCFKSYLKQDNSIYYLPQISFGIISNVCHIYAIQNKDTKYNTDPNYNKLVRDKVRTINSGINKYRNVTPSFVVALTTFITFLNDNNISNLIVESPLPLRINNRDLATKERLRIYTLEASLNEPVINQMKQALIDKNINDNLNSTEKFVNCFNRLKLHFDNIILNNNILDNEMILSIIKLTTTNNFLSEIVEKDNDTVLKY